MAAVPKNRVMFSSVTDGTADFEVGTAITGYLTPSDAGYADGDRIPYTAESADKTEWEVGLGTWDDSGGILERTTVRQSSNSNAAVDFTNPPTVFVAPHAEDLNPWGLREITAGGTVTVQPEDRIIAINQTVGAAISVQLPACADRDGVPLTIVDWKGDAGTNNISLIVDGVETINGAAATAYKIQTDHGAIQLWPKKTGGWYTIV